MAASDSLLSAEAQRPEQSAAFARLYAASRGAEVGLSGEEFIEILREIAVRYLAAQPSDAEQMGFWKNLQLEELALARACAKGSETAWERFVARYRPKLRQAARAIAHEEAAACELADSLYAELFGTRQTTEGARISKLASYTGRGSLEGWLKTVLAQEYINRIRRERRLVSFDERIGEGAHVAESGPSSDARLQESVEAAFRELSGEERMMLASYYLDGRRLAEIARMLGTHESTVKRRLDKITGALRKKILRLLRQRGMSAREAEQAITGGAHGLDINFGLLARSADANRSTERRVEN